MQVCMYVCILFSRFSWFFFLSCPQNLDLCCSNSFVLLICEFLSKASINLLVFSSYIQRESFCSFRSNKFLGIHMYLQQAARKSLREGCYLGGCIVTRLFSIRVLNSSQLNCVCALAASLTRQKQNIQHFKNEQQINERAKYRA